MAKWLLKTEPNTYSIDDLKKDRTTQWDSVRNYQARNYMQEMSVGDEVFIYHSNAEPPGIVGIGKIAKSAYPDPTQFDKKSDYFDEKATKDAPRWFAPDIRFVKKFAEVLPLPELRKVKKLSGMELLRKGSRLSVQPVSEAEWKAIVEMVGNH